MWTRWRQRGVTSVMYIERIAVSGSGAQRRGKSFLRVAVMGWGLVLGSAPQATPLFVERAEAARPDREALVKAERQVREHKEVEPREVLAVPPFHKRVAALGSESETYCQGCHRPLPHSKKPRTRSFLNMHSRFIACETCHFRPEDTALEYRWLDYPARREAPVDAQRFRTGRNLDNSLRIDGRVKIAPFHRGEPAVTFPGSEFAERVARIWRDGDIAAKARLKARIHAPLQEKGPECTACHTEERPLLDLVALGASVEQALAIRRHLLPQFFARFKEDDERLKITDILR